MAPAQLALPGAWPTPSLEVLTVCDGTRPIAGAATVLRACDEAWLEGLVSRVEAAVVILRQLEMTARGLPWADLSGGDSYLDAREVSEFLDVKPRTVSQWGSRGRLPEPELVLGSTKLWKRSTILRWAGDTGRLSSPALRDEYEARWKVEPVQRRMGGRIPERPTPIGGGSPRAAEPTAQAAAAVSMDAPEQHVDRGIGDV